MPEFLFSLKERKEVAEQTMAFWFDTSHSNFSFKAGQFVKITLINPSITDAEGNARSFSIASSPNNKDAILITTRMGNTAFKSNLQKMSIGDKVKVIGPMGIFTLHQDVQKPAVFLAGGIGVTPFRSIVEWATQEKLPNKIYLFYSNRTKTATAFMKDFEQWAKENKNFKFIPTLTDEKDSSWRYETGIIDERLLRKHIPEKEFQKAIFYIAGPPGMVTGMEDLLTRIKIGKEQIKVEEFTGY
ncbi:FAD-dependent oxidoreductase [Candidatus Woesearchaeota archaeon]|nr:FAD-dependent oxidoreductase [Candidatus Woesearchaeota archaeon]